MARLDILRAVSFLAAQITKWSPLCDRRLDRLMCYVWSSLELRQVAWCNDIVENLSVRLYAGAGFAGCLETSRSTSGVYLCIRGPGTAFPIAGSSQRQTHVSHSTPEAEIVAADFAIRTIGIPALTLWSTLLQKDACLQFHEDNQAMIAVMKSGRSDKL